MMKIPVFDKFHQAPELPLTKKTVVMSERIESLLKQERTAAYHLYKPIHHQIITSLPQTMSQTVKPSLIIISN